MAIPVYLWLEDNRGSPVKGSVDIKGREGAIEVTELMHSVEQKTDPITGKITSKQLHSSYAFMKDTDISSPYLYNALSTGQTLKRPSSNFIKSTTMGKKKSTSSLRWRISELQK